MPSYEAVEIKTTKADYYKDTTRLQTCMELENTQKRLVKPSCCEKKANKQTRRQTETNLVSLVALKSQYVLSANSGRSG